MRRGDGSLSLCLRSGAWAVPAFGQTDVNDVHVPPREVEKPPEVPKPDLLASTPGLSAHVRPLKVDVDLVLVPVTITDPMNRLVTGLDKENFQLFEGNSAQEIRTFSSEDAPVSLGVIFDSSGSMSSKMERAKDAVIEFFKTANPQDEFFMITFSDEPEAVSDFTSSVDEIQNKLVFAVPRHRTALLDAIYMGISKMRAGQVSQEGAADHFRRRRQSQPLHRGRDQVAGEGSRRDDLRHRHLRPLRFRHGRTPGAAIAQRHHRTDRGPGVYRSTIPTTWGTWRPRSVWSCAINMSWDTVRAKWCATANGVR